ncbi:type II toxin-antitoxin system ParD family antitoxin [Tistrella mobilis]|uniref:ribbon-helix-helix domain-containing protein n=1 Tax=Tistrella mobilis TaxID=171437 RepID=UPI003557CA90
MPWKPANTPRTSEAIREAVREWQERRDLLGYTVDELRVLVQEGIDSGPATPFDPESIDHEGRRLLKLVEARHD